MIDAERMLGSLVRNAMSGGGRKRRRKRGRRSSMLGTAGKGALAMGALGVAIAAFEHFSKGQGSGSMFDGPPPSGGTDPWPKPSTAVPPPPPPPGAAQAVVSAGPPPPPPPAPSTGSSGEQAEALLLVRAMIAAANADHVVDDEERRRIVDALAESGLSDEEREFFLAELESPIGLGALADQAATPELARQIYLASLMAIEVDTQAERNYLARLSQRLGLDATQVAELEGMLASDGSSEPE